MHTAHPKIRRNLALLLFPFESGSVFSIGAKIAKILSSFLENVYFISSGIPKDMEFPEGVSPIDLDFGRISLNKERKVLFLSSIEWLIKNFVIQAKMGLEIFKQRENIDFVFCALSGFFQIPLIVGKLLGKKIIVFAGGESSLIARIIYGKIVAGFIKNLNSINYLLSDVIIVESEIIKEEEIFRNFKKKIRNGALYFGDAELFVKRLSIYEREESIGYIGRISPEKGIIEFVKSIPYLVEERPNLKILIIGSGPSDGEIIQHINDLKSDNVTRISWVEKKDLPELMNRIRLLVIPSKIEGLPNILLEAISCGTPIITTRVGGIPDIITEGKTGFFFPSLKPEKIAETILSVLNDEELLENTNREAKVILDSNYSLNASVERYSKIFHEI